MAEGGIGLDAIMCDLCEKEPAQFFCRTCDGNLCNECKEDHKRKKMFIRHDVVKMTLTRKMEMEGYGYCTEHQESKYELSCQACAVPVCTKCIADKHNGHKMTDISSAYLEAKRGISTILKEIKETLLPKHRRNLVDLDTLLDDVNKQTRDLEQNVIQHSRELTDCIQLIEKEFLNKIYEEKKGCNSKISAKRTEVEDHISSLQKLQETLTESRDSKNMAELILYMTNESEIAERNRELPLLSYQPASFISNASNQNVLGILFGILFPSRMSTLKPEKSIMTKCTEIKKIKCSLKSPIGLFFCGHNQDAIWVRGGGAFINKLDIHGEVLATVSTQTKYGKPSGLIEMEEGTVLYTDLENKNIRKLSNNLQKQEDINTEWHPTGMCKSQSGHILVCVAYLSIYVTNESDVGKILMMDCEGNIFQEIQKNSEDENLYIRPICITENINQDVCVSDRKRHSLIVVDRTGLFRFAYGGGFNQRNEKVFLPYELDNDSAGNIIVSDFPNKLVHLVTIDGNIFKHILTETDGITRPRGLIVDNEDKLWITEEDSGSIKVFQYLE